MAKTSLIGPHIESVAGCITIVVLREGGARLAGDADVRVVRAGDAVILSQTDAPVLIAEAGSRSVGTFLHIDRAYLADQMYWQHAGLFLDHLDAARTLAGGQIRPTRIVRLGSDQVRLQPWLDELSVISGDGLPSIAFYRAQALLFAILHVVVPQLTVLRELRTSTDRREDHQSLRGHREHLPFRREARQVDELMRGDLCRRWRISELASEVHLSPSQLNRVFVGVFGEPPIAHLTTLRIEQMAMLLQGSDAPVTDIARQVGWNSVDFATRQFRRAVGVTPTEYRAQNGSPASRPASA